MTQSIPTPSGRALGTILACALLCVGPGVRAAEFDAASVKPGDSASQGIPAAFDRDIATAWTSAQSQPDGIGVSEKSAAERRKPGSHDHGKIELSRISDDIFFETARGFRDHRMNQARHSFRPLHRPLPLDPEDGEDAFRVRLGALSFMGIKPLPCLSSQAA